MKNNEIELLKKFLEREKVFSKFKKATENQNNCTLDHYLLKKSLTFRTVIMAAFDWHDTSDGVMFWKRVNDGWIMYYKENYKQ